MDQFEIKKTADEPVVVVQHLSKAYKGKVQVQAVADVSFAVRPGEIFGLIGPDGAGKTSILQMMAGVASVNAGTIRIKGFDPGQNAEAVKNIIGYMPQGIGLNLYDAMSVKENIEFFRDLRQMPPALFAKNCEKMLHMTRLEPFLSRLAKNLSGGMRQKLSLICTLVHLPDILLLDEPTTGVDPRSRQEFWQIILDLVTERQVAVVLSTSYMDEASRCSQVALLHEGHVIQQGKPEVLKSLLVGEVISCVASPQYKAFTCLQQWQGAAVPQVFGRRLQMRLMASPKELVEYLAAQGVSCCEVKKVMPTLDDVFVQLTRKETQGAVAMPFAHSREMAAQTVVDCCHVTIQFDSFRAVDDISCSIHAGEVFGLLGPNGAGKTTLLKSMCGLLAPTAGCITTAGYDVTTDRQHVWSKIGYMSQRFSLYRELTVKENIALYTGLYNVNQVDYSTVLQSIGLAEQANRLAGKLPLGIRQRLSLVCAILHEPPVVFLDEPTSGVDPVARREFWNIIHQLTRELGKTVLVSTHYMDEAERCDRVILMDQGQLVALDSPDGLKAQMTAAYGQLLVVTAENVRPLYALVKKTFPAATFYGQEIHLRSHAVSHDLPVLEALLRPVASAVCAVQELSMEETFMDFINHREV